MNIPTPLKVLVVTSGQPSLNPRMVKEADALVDAGYDVTVLYAYWNAWGTKFDTMLLASKKWDAICAGGDPEQKPGVYFFSRIIHKSSILLTNAGLSYFAKFAIARSSFFLIREAQRHKADLYIGHNLGALPAIVKASKVHKKPCGFDLEDFHRYEAYNNNNAEGRLKIAIENTYIPRTHFLTASSRQIAGAYQLLFPGKNPIILLNVFSYLPRIILSESNPSDPVKLLWFSQTIGTKRGIEDILGALQLLENDQFELHLLGAHSKQTIEYFDKLNDCGRKIYLHPPIAPWELVNFAAQFDIGLALEPGFSINNDFALSNKIFTYIQAGLAIIVSDTTAQKELLNKYPAIGQVYEKGNIQMLRGIIKNYFDNRKGLFETKKASLEIACNELNWEKESKKLLKVITDTLAV